MSTLICARSLISKANTSRQAIFLLRRLNSTVGIEKVDEKNVLPVTQNEYYDIVVVGGGMVGTAMAKALGRKNKAK